VNLGSKFYFSRSATSREMNYDNQHGAACSRWNPTDLPTEPPTESKSICGTHIFWILVSICGMIVFICVSKIVYHICMTYLFRILLYCLFIIGRDISNFRIFWIVGKIDRWCIIYCLFWICRDKGVACLLFLHILPFAVIQYLKYARIVCGCRLLFYKFYICRKICNHHILIKIL
jgi:hypothetical protein